MNSKLKLPLIISSVFLVLALNSFILIKAYQSMAGHQEMEKSENEPQPNQLMSAINHLDQRKPLIFEKSSLVAPLPLEEVSVEEKIKIQILNASGISGSAIQLKEKLIDIEGVDIVIGNTQNTTSNTFISKVNISKDIKNMILEIVESELSDVDQEDLPEESEMDIIIILGG